MRNAWLLSLIGLLGCNAPSTQPASILLIGMVGQTCRGTLKGDVTSDVVYTIAIRDGKWLVHDIFGTHGALALRDIGWLPATGDGSTLTFAGVTGTIMLTATGEHVMDMVIISKNTQRSFTTMLACDID